MTPILKRLELIKTSIALEDEEIIELQTIKLHTMDIDDDVKVILELISSHDFSGALEKIEGYLRKYSGVIVYEDKEIGALKFELKVLEQKIQEVSDLKLQMTNAIQDFNFLYSSRLGEVLKKVLELRQRLLYMQTHKKRFEFEALHKEYQELKEEYGELKAQKEELEEELQELDEFDDRYEVVYEELQKLNQEITQREAVIENKRKQLKEAKHSLEEDETYKNYEEAEDDFESFSREYEEVVNKERFELDEVDLVELKALYRKAAKLCHPDIVADELKEQAMIIIQELNNAYEKQDLETIRKILRSLENGAGFDVASDKINDKELLRSKINTLREKLEETEQEILSLQEDDVYQLIQDIDDFDNYFDEIKNTLEEECKSLEDQIEQKHEIIKQERVDDIRPQEIASTLEFESKLTPHQKSLYDGIISDIQNIIDKGNLWENTISLTGSAGVGKTYMTMAIIKKLQSLKLSLSLTTPTHKSLGVAKEMLEAFDVKVIRTQTIHAFLNVKLSTDYNTGKRGFQIDQKGRDKSYADVLIVDESSMIGEELLMHIDQAVKEKRVKVVLFVGDPYQLPPVDKASVKLQKLLRQYKLEEVIRQAKDSYIIKIASKIRDLIEAQDFSMPVDKLLQGLMADDKIYGDDNAFTNAFFSNGTNWSEKDQIFTAFSNDTVDMYNKIARNRYWSEKGLTNLPQFVSGDKVVFQDANMKGDTVVHYNNEVAELVSAEKKYDSYLDLWYWDCLDTMLKSIKIVDDESLSQYNATLNEYMKEAKSKKDNTPERSRAWREYYDLIDRYCRVKYVFASTIHKTQGSTYEDIFIDLRGIIRLDDEFNVGSKELAYRLTYVALTRASKNAYVLLK